MNKFRECLAIGLVVAVSSALVVAVGEMTHDVGVWVVAWGDSGDFRWSNRPRPKGDLDRALAYARDLVPRDRVVPVVLEQNRPWWEPAVVGCTMENITSQPFDRGSAPGILTAALRIRAREPDAVVVIVWTGGALPAREAVLRAVREAQSRRAAVVIPSTAEDAPTDGVLDARTVLVCPVAELVALFRAVSPEIVAELDRPELYAAPSRTLDMVFPFLPDTDFVDEVLAPAQPRLQRLAD